METVAGDRPRQEGWEPKADRRIGSYSVRWEPEEQRHLALFLKALSGLGGRGTVQRLGWKQGVQAFLPLSWSGMAAEV